MTEETEEYLLESAPVPVISKPPPVIKRAATMLPPSLGNSSTQSQPKQTSRAAPVPQKRERTESPAQPQHAAKAVAEEVHCPIVRTKTTGVATRDVAYAVPAHLNSEMNPTLAQSELASGEVNVSSIDGLERLLDGILAGVENLSDVRESYPIPERPEMRLRLTAAKWVLESRSGTDEKYKACVYGSTPIVMEYVKPSRLQGIFHAKK